MRKEKKQEDIEIIPVGKMSKVLIRLEAEQHLRNIKMYKDDYFFPTEPLPHYNDLTEEQKLHVNMTEDMWKELTTQERKERLLPKEEQDEIFRKSGFVDWNNYDLDYLADYLEKKWMFMSSGEALAICKLIDFYREHKNKENGKK